MDHRQRSAIPVEPRVVRHSGRYLLLVAGVLAAGGMARLVSSAGVPLVFDEFQWIAIADRISLSPFFLPLHGDAHPAGGAYVAALGSWIAGHNIIGYRLGSVLCGTAMIWIAWRLGVKQFGPTVGLGAAVLVAFNEYLLGISRYATQEAAFLAASAAAVLAFIHALEHGGVKRYAYVGLFLGLGLFLKEMMILWIPLFAWELASRKGPRALLTRGPALALLITFLGAVPDIAWNAFYSVAEESGSNRGLVQQAARFGLGWSLGPAALFSRPLVVTLEQAVAEYPAHSFVPGLVLLGGALGSILLWRLPDVRIWLRLGWGPFVFFTLAGNPATDSPEFWWSDLSVLPFAMLTAITLTRLSPAALGLGLLLSVPAALTVVQARENCYPSAATRTGPAIDYCLNSQRMYLARFPDRDLGEISSVGPWKLPVAEHYERWGRVYAARLAEPDPPMTDIPWPVIAEASRATELARVERMLRTLRAR